MTKRKPVGTLLRPGPKPKTAPCTVSDCTSRGAIRGMRIPHYEAWRRVEHRERRNAQWASWRDRNATDAEASARMARSRADTLERYRSNNAESVKESSRTYARRRRALLLSAPSEPWTDEIVIATYGSDCHLCGDAIDLKAPRLSRDGAGWERGLHVDHVTPITRGGSDLLENLRPSHALCNIRKNNTLPQMKEVQA